MAWDSTRTVQWQRLVRDWLIYVSIMAVVFLFIYRDGLIASPFIGLLISGPLFVGFGAVLAKFGHQRKTLRDLRAETEARRQTPAESSPQVRGRPAPTRRTSTGPGRHPSRKAKRR